MFEDSVKKETLAAVMNAFQIDIVIVIDDRALFKTLEEIDGKKTMIIKSLAKSDGAVQID